MAFIFLVLFSLSLEERIPGSRLVRVSGETPRQVRILAVERRSSGLLASKEGSEKWPVLLPGV